MNDLFRMIDEILVSEAKVSPQDTLSEAKVCDYPNTKLKAKGKYLLYKFDRDELKNTVFSLFKDINKLKEVCDYVIFCPVEKQSVEKQSVLFVFLCDLKSENTNGAVSQVNATKILVEYIIQMACRQLDYRHYHVEYRALILSTAPNRQYYKTNVKKPISWQEDTKSGLKFHHLKAGSIIFLGQHCT